MSEIREFETKMMEFPYFRLGEVDPKLPLK